MSNVLKKSEIINIASNIAEKIGIKLPPHEDIIRQISSKKSLTLLLQNYTHQMWIDKYYIAYSALAEKKIHYAYLTHQHIAEEYKSYSDARTSHGNNVELPVGIKHTFKMALKNMEFTGKNHFIAEN